MREPAALKAELRRTWRAFFARHGHFTAAQLAAMPPILSGRDVLVVAPTASGKTEAVLAPLIERHVPPGAPPRAPLILYVCPTRALVRDLFERLSAPLAELGVGLAMKTGDTGPLAKRRRPTVLLTTPESTDSMLARSPRLLAELRALVVDEVHLLDGHVRGDQLRCLLPRIERVRAYRSGERGADATRMQRVALSATVDRPEELAARYLVDPRVVVVPGGRAIAWDSRPLSHPGDLAAALAGRGARKTLVFCNTRHEVESVAAALRRQLPYEAPVFAHYSNLDPAVRRDVEQRFAQASVAVCVSSATLEIGVDIGSVDDVVLIGAPHTLSSFLQRIGRGGRRTGTTRVLCLPRDAAEALRFATLLAAAERPAEAVGASDVAGNVLAEWQPRYAFKPSVVVQQAFSFLVQSPTGSLRLADLRRLAPAEVPDDALGAILAQLAADGYLAAGRDGEWRAGPAMDALLDQYAVHSNLGDAPGGPAGASVVDADTGRRIARADRPRRAGETLLLGGRRVAVAWQAGYTFGVRPSRGGRTDEVLRFRSSPFAVPVEVTRPAALQLGLRPRQVPVFALSGATWVFHFWGDLYGALLAAVLDAGRRREGGDAKGAAGAGAARGAFDVAPGAGPEADAAEPLAAQGGLYVVVPWVMAGLESGSGPGPSPAPGLSLGAGAPAPPVRLPPWDANVAEEAAHDLLPRAVPYLELGCFAGLLPAGLRTASALEHLDVPRFERLYRGAELVAAGPDLQDTLLGLV